MGRPNSGPRPVVLGTCTLSPYSHPDPDDLDGMLQAGLDLLDDMARAADAQGEALDLVAWPEYFAQGEPKPAKEKAEPVDGRTIAAVAERIRKLNTNAAVPLCLREGDAYFNAIVFLDRQGEHVGTYAKAHPCFGNGAFECGVQPGLSAQVFDLDIGRVGAQICYDVFFGSGWKDLAQAGAELVVFSSATPAVARVKAYACLHEYYVLTSTWNVPTIVATPLGYEMARTRKHKEVLVQKVDLEFIIANWMPEARARALEERYKGRIRQEFFPEDQQYLFTSLDPDLPVAEMFRREKLVSRHDGMARNLAAENEAKQGLAGRPA